MDNAPARVRPRLHLTARAGWTNDPHGLVHHDGRYHLFFQHNPAGLGWAPAIHWGQAVSEDLLTWEEVDTALAPEPGETGCWSGAAVVTDDGPVIAYTRVRAPDLGRGAVVLARPAEGMTRWVRDPAEPVVDGPPDDLDAIGFRDPMLRRRGDGWVAVLGAGTADGEGCALQYGVSADLRTWTYEGVLASRPADATDPVWTGQIWECPQLVEVDGRWVLLVSVWSDGVIHHVVAAVGDRDGLRFTPCTWARLTHGDLLYATTTFTDAEGRPGALTWLRETGDVPPEGSPWCSAMSLPHLLSVRATVDGDRLELRPHPNLDAVLPPLWPAGPPPATAEAEVPATEPWRVVADVPDGGGLTLAWGPDATGAVALTGDTVSGWTVRAGAEDVLHLPAGPSSADGSPGRLDVVQDADILEVSWSGSGIGAVRLPVPTRATRVRVTARQSA